MDELTIPLDSCVIKVPKVKTREELIEETRKIIDQEKYLNRKEALRKFDENNDIQFKFISIAEVHSIIFNEKIFCSRFPPENELKLFCLYGADYAFVCGWLIEYDPSNKTYYNTLGELYKYVIEEG